MKFPTACLLIAALGVPLAHGANYPLGTMTCDDIGRFASETMADKKNGRTREEALAALESRTYGDPVERRNLTDVIEILYGNLGRNLGVQSAGSVMKTDCEAGRSQ
ncbi:MAG: hypothetical protein KIT73_20575 [Burkholderiales bacterium]|nr:hypothetical protein [Burkholderiales bacterium]